MAALGNFASNPKTAVAVVSTANTNRDGTGTLATIVSGATRDMAASPPLAGGTRVDALAVAATGTTTAGMLRLFLHDGTNARLLAEVPVAAVTPSATLAAWAVRLTKESCDFMPIVLAPGASLRMGTHNAETFHATTPQAGDF
jgi:hypothetical protein